MLRPAVFPRVLFLLVYFSIVLMLGACGGGGGGGGGGRIPQPTPTPDPEPPPLTSLDPEYHLGTARFTTHQPDVLEQIGAHHAYARGLTGRGVRIGIDDSIVDYTQRAEFGSRVKLTEADGAKLYYDRFVADFESDTVRELYECGDDPTCVLRTIDSGGDSEAVNSAARQIVSERGMPLRDDSVFMVDQHYGNILLDERAPIEQRWLALQQAFKEVPTPYGGPGGGGHGTIVASVAAGKTLGVAPEATIVPIATNLLDSQTAARQVELTVRDFVETVPSEGRRMLDNELEGYYQNYYAKFDIINRSWGRRASYSAVLNEYRDVQWHSQFLPKTLNAWGQVNTPSAEKTIVVYATGNDSDRVPGLGAALPYFFPALRDHTISVVATDPATGLIAGYSNWCGSLPPDWDATRHGPHYCLAAPGTVRGLVPNPNTPGQGDVQDGIPGTSFAAPIVSGALALMMEHFRGTRDNTAVVKRMLDTADRSGHYAELETYGAGFLDIEAALSPVGTLSAGQSARSLGRTMLHTPFAFGTVALRTSNLELAVFDKQDFPFWIPLSSRIAAQEVGRSPIPTFDEDTGSTAGLDALGQRWATLTAADRSWLRGGDWVAGFGLTSASLARQPGGQGWGYGLSFNDGGYLGSRTSGAFGSDLRSGFSWISRSFEHELGASWSVKATGTLAFGAPHYEKKAIFEASPSVLSALSIRIGTDRTGITLGQPLRAETGTGTFRVENGQIENGRRLYEEHRIRLRPDSREVRMTLRHEHDAYGGRIAFEVGATMNARHTAGEYESHVGLAFRGAW